MIYLLLSFACAFVGAVAGFVIDLALNGRETTLSPVLVVVSAVLSLLVFRLALNG
jgi:hypothetical protein